MVRGRQRGNGEGSIFPYRNGYAAYVWVTTPAGKRGRKWVYGKTREDVHGRWLKLHDAARRGPVATSSPSLAEYLAYWLREVVVEPDYAPLTCATYETLTRLYILPGLGSKRLDKLTLRDVRGWLNKLRDTCQCCAQRKDARRPERKRRCCAKIPATCCRRVASERTVRDAWTILCSALTNAVTEELIPRNVARLLHVSKPRKRRVKPWTAEEARQFLESAKRDQDPLYAAYVLILVLGLRKGEVIGLSWSAVDLDRAELDIGWQLQRVGRQLLHRETKTEASGATLPLPGICVTALRIREKDQAAARAAAGDGWAQSGLIFTTRPVHHSNRATSTGVSRRAAPRRVSGSSRFMTCGIPAPPSWLRSTCILGWRCGSSVMHNRRHDERLHRGLRCEDAPGAQAAWQTARLIVVAVLCCCTA
jgi:integrase